MIIFDVAKTKLRVNLSDTIYDVKIKYDSETGVPANRQTLKFGGRTLDNASIVSDCNIRKGSQLHVSAYGVGD